jgi:hypothetical protein
MRKNLPIKKGIIAGLCYPLIIVITRGNIIHTFNGPIIKNRKKRISPVLSMPFAFDGGPLSHRAMLIHDRILAVNSGPNLELAGMAYRLLYKSKTVENGILGEKYQIKIMKDNNLRF